MKSFFCSLVAFAIAGYVSNGYAQSALCKQVEESYKKQCADSVSGIGKVETKVRYEDNKLIVDCYRKFNNGKSDVVHFGPSPCNGTNPTPPSQPVVPPLPEEIPVTETEPAIDNSARECGSIILTDNQVLGESVSVVGTSFELAYFSNKVVGRKGDYKLKIPLTLGSYSSKLTHVKYTVKIEGKVVDSKTVAIAPNLTVEYVWNGVSTGKSIGSVLAEVIVEKIPNGGVTSFPVTIGSLQAKNLGFGGWVPTNYHFYDINRKQVLRGDGSSLSTPAELLAGNQLRVVDSDRSQVYIFDVSTGKHLFTKSFWLGADLLTFNYDLKGLLVSITEPFGLRTTFNRNSAGDLLSITAPNGQITQITLDSNKLISLIISPSGQIYSLTYFDGNGLLRTFQKPQGQVSSFIYDTFGNLIQDAHSGGYSVSLNKSIDGDETTIISSTQMGRTTSYLTSNLLVPNEGTGNSDKYYQRVEVAPNEQVKVTINSSDLNVLVADDVVYTTAYKNDERFKEFSQVVRKRSVSGSTFLASTEREESFVLSDLNNPFSIKNYTLSQSDQNGEKTITTYDGATRTFVKQTSRGVKIVTKIDAYERLVSVQSGNDLPKVFIYTNDKLTRVSQGTRFVDYIYDPNTKQLASTKNVLGQAIKYSYDSSGRLISKIYPDLKNVLFNYDENNKLTGIIPSEKPQHNFIFNSLELLTSYSPPVLDNSISTPTVYAYNDDKQLSSVTKPDGQVITYNYESEKGTLDSIESPEGVYTYNFNSERGSYDKIRTPRNIVTHRQMQPGGFVERDMLLKGSATLGTYAAEINDRGFMSRDLVQGLIDGGVSWVNYYTTNDGKIEVAGNEQISYDSTSGRIISSLIHEGPNFVSEKYSYNQYGELSSYTAETNSGTVYSLTLNYDDLGRVVKKSEVIRGNSTTYEYSYDLRSRLTEVKQNGAVVRTYKYDGNGNRIYGAINGQAIAATYDSQDRVVQYNSESFQYNLNGELVLKKNNVTTQETLFSFNSFGTLTAVKVGSSTFSYEVDGLGRRILNTINGKVKDTFIYSGQQRLVGTIGADGKLLQRYVYATKSHVPDYISTYNDSYRIITDHLGSVRLVIRVSDGAVMQELLHDEFGRVLKSTAPDFQPFGFAGGLHDQNTNLVQFGARWYDSQIGRWISKDPIKFEGGDNLYAYTSNDPINQVDVDGLSPMRITNEGGAGVGGGGGGGSLAIPAIQGLINIFSSKSLPGPGKGPPNGSLELEDEVKGGKRQKRYYDENGNPVKDIDYNHDHGQGVPHVHDWNSPTDRGPGRPPTEGECDD